MLVQDVLANGLKVTVEPQSDVKTVIVSLWIHQGSKFEKKENNGISHILEHIIFHFENQKELSNLYKKLQSSGAQMRAETTKDGTYFYVAAQKQYLSDCLSFLYLLVAELDLDEEKIKKERKIIQEEHSMYHSSSRIIHELTTMSLFGDVSIGQKVIGREEVIANFDKKDLRRIFDNRYKPNNAVLVIMGNVSLTKIDNLVKSHFSSWEGRAKSWNTHPIEDTPTLIVRRDNSNQVLFGFPLRSVEFGHPLEYTNRLLAYILGKGLESRLYKEIREEHQLVYQISAHARHYQEGGSLSIVGNADKGNIPEIIKRIKDVLNSLVANNVRSEEINKAKQLYKTRLLLNEEKRKKRMKKIGRNVLLGNNYFQNEEIQNIFSVSKQNIVSLLEKIWGGDEAVASFVGIGDFNQDEVLKLIP
jgi:predicted Zn-dependent peptidase